jgi:hypothetical protein
VCRVSPWGLNALGLNYFHLGRIVLREVATGAGDVMMRTVSTTVIPSRD